jgi:hypothetical protein
MIKRYLNATFLASQGGLFKFELLTEIRLVSQIPFVPELHTMDDLKPDGAL